MTEHLALLLRLHDGDDRCGCLRLALEQAVEGEPETIVTTTIEACLRTHPAGSRYRA